MSPTRSRTRIAVLAVASLLALGGCNTEDCSESAPEVEWVRSIPAARWAQAIDDLKELRLRGGNQLFWAIGNASPIPEAFDDLGVIKVDATEGQIPSLTFQGCYDHFIVVYVTDIAKSPVVTLHWGSGPTAGKQVLWSAPAETPGD